MVGIVLSNIFESLRNIRIVLSIRYVNPDHIVDSYENQKQIVTISHNCRMEKQKSDKQIDIFVNDKNVMEMEEETKEYISTKPVRIVTIGRELILLVNND